MIPRIEQKLEIAKSDYLVFLKWLSSRGFKVLYPERKVLSIYYDNYELEMFNNTVEGIVPRKKIRIRTYNTSNFLNSKESYTLEVKMTTKYRRLKSANNIINLEEKISQGIFDPQYGICFPKIEISYSREYFYLNNYRVTIDKNINYRKINESFFDNNIKEDISYVLEIKAKANESKTELANFFDFPRTRFSKYERGIELLQSDFVY